MTDTYPLYKRNALAFMALLAILLLASACGGSSSDSGGSNVIYVGEQHIRIAQARIVSAPKTTTFRLDRNAGQVTVVDKDFQASGALTGEIFSLTSPEIQINVSGRPCSYSITYTGRLTQSGISGTLNGPLYCGLTAALSGDFEATAVSAGNSTVLPSVSTLITGN